MAVLPADGGHGRRCTHPRQSKVPPTGRRHRRLPLIRAPLPPRTLLPEKLLSEETRASSRRALVYPTKRTDERRPPVSCVRLPPAGELSAASSRGNRQSSARAKGREASRPLAIAKANSVRTNPIRRTRGTQGWTVFHLPLIGPHSSHRRARRRAEEHRRSRRRGDLFFSDADKQALRPSFRSCEPCLACAFTERMVRSVSGSGSARHWRGSRRGVPPIESSVSMAARRRAPAMAFSVSWPAVVPREPRCFLGVDVHQVESTNELSIRATEKGVLGPASSNNEHTRC
nr:uncharacterized protein LOC117849784 isoform X3 [Setaria viridis]